MISFERNEIGFGPAYIVNKCEFLSITDAIKTSKLVNKIDSAEIGLFNFWIVRNNLNEKFGTETKKDTKEVFDAIVQQIQNKKTKDDVDLMFLDVIRQIKALN